MVMSEFWYACIYESERRIIYGRAPVGETEDIVDQIKRSLRFHKLIGLQSQIFLKESRFQQDDFYDFCEEKMEKESGDYRGFRSVKVDLRWEKK